MPEIENMVYCASFPNIKRGILLHKLWVARNRPKAMMTDKVTWDDMILVMKGNEDLTVSGLCYIDSKLMKIGVYQQRMEQILDCCSKTLDIGSKFVLKFSVFVPRQRVEFVQCNLFDAIVEINGETGEMIGVAKLRHKSVKRGLAKLMLKKCEDNNFNLQVIVEHEHPQGVKALFTSIASRTNPRFKGSVRNLTDVQTAFRHSKSASNEVDFAKRLLSEAETEDEIKMARDILRDCLLEAEIKNDILKGYMQND